MRKLKSILMMLAIVATTLVSYASGPEKAPTPTKVNVPTYIPIIQIGSPNVFLFTNGQILSALNAGGATCSPQIIYTTFNFEFNGSDPILLAHGFRADTPSISVITPTLLILGSNSNGPTYGLGEAPSGQGSWSCETFICCNECSYDFGTQNCGCKYSPDWCPVTMPLGLQKCRKYSTSIGWFTTVKATISAYQ